MFIQRKHRVSLLSALIFAALQTHASTPVKQKKSPWHGSQIKFGLNITTGNTSDREVNSAVNLDYDKAHWGDNLDFAAAYARSSGVLSKKKYSIKNEIRYGFDIKRRHYLFLSGSWAEDWFSPYLYQSTVAGGYGRDLINTNRIVLSVQIGPGYRCDKVRGSNEKEDRLIGTAQVFGKVKITKSSYLKEILQYESGPPFQYINSATSFNTVFSKHWATQITFNLEYYSKIPPRSSHTKKLDTTTTASIVYTFK